MMLMLRAIHGRDPKLLGEDFAGTAALSRHWIANVAGGEAVAVDIDAETLGVAGTHPKLQTIVGDVHRVNAKVDCLFVGNFSIGYLHTRDDLIKYLGHAKSRLKENGVFVCDTYGGETAYIRGNSDRDVPLQNGLICKYRWEQREADPISGMVTNAIHFRVFAGDEVIADMHDAFIYRWRLWSLPELSDAMLQVGFVSTDIYSNLPDAVDDEGDAFAEPITDPDWLGDSFIVCVAGRTTNL
jgi:SAM-dependent methyltransferase